MKFFDTHAHCDDKRFESEYEGGTHGVITDCLNDNVSHIINIGTNLENSKVSVEFDSAGQDRFLEGLNQIMEQVERIRQIGEVGDNKIKFFDPSTVKVTTESLTELQAKAQEIEEAFKDVQKELSHAIEFGKDVSGNDAKITKLKDDLSEIGKAAGLVTKDFSQMQEELKELVNISVDEVSKAALAKKAREEKIINDAKAENSKIS
jgi:Tat protein secretion system quality control protein TatD with DNase activity